MPTVRKASGPMSLYDPQEGSPDSGSNAIAAERPLLYVRGTHLFLSFELLTRADPFLGSF